MALKTLVKVGNISNLSDARYCAGMGVDLLGYAVIEGQPNYIPLKLYQDIRGWVAGPSAVLELYGLTDNHNVPQLLEDYRPDFLEADAAALKQLNENLGVPLIISINTMDDLSHVEHWKGQVSYLLANSADLAHVASSIAPTILNITSTSFLSLLETLPVKGIALSGSPELRPGFKEYGDLAEVLEQLEVD